MEIIVPVPPDADSPKFKTTVGSVKYVPEQVRGRSTHVLKNKAVNISYKSHKLSSWLFVSTVVPNFISLADLSLSPASILLVSGQKEPRYGPTT